MPILVQSAKLFINRIIFTGKFDHFCLRQLAKEHVLDSYAFKAQSIKLMFGSIFMMHDSVMHYEIY